MSDPTDPDEIKWESAFSDDSLDVDLPDISENADEPDPEKAPSAATVVDDVVAVIVPQTPESRSLADIVQAPPEPVVAQPPPPTPPQSAPPTPQVTQQMPATVPISAPPPVREKRGVGFPVKRVVQVLAGVVPLAVAAYFFLSNGGDPKEALCDKAGQSADGVQDGLGNTVSSKCDDAVGNTEPDPSVVTDPVVTDPVVTESVVTEPPAPLPTSPPLAFVYPAGINDVAADGALASGCTPDTDAVPDGIWFVLLSSWSSESVTVDFSCAYTGVNADAQALLRGELVQQPKIYLTNDNQKLRTVSFAADATIIVPPQVAANSGLDPSYQDVDYFDPVLGVLASGAGSDVPLFIFVNNGVLTEMVVQNIDAVQIAGPLLPTATSNCPADQEPPTPVVEVSGIPSNDPDGGLNVRAAPVDGNIFFAAPNGTKLNVTGGCSYINGLAWWEVQTFGSTGWASSKYLIASSA